MNVTPTMYDIDSEKLLSYVYKGNIKSLSVEEMETVYELAADKLLEKVLSGEIWFPFHKYFTDTPDILFNNLKNINLPILTGPYQLKSYYPEYSSFLPPKFRGIPTIIASNEETYHNSDVLSDHFIEDIRLQSKRYDQSKSVIECWEDSECIKTMLIRALKNPNITPETLRNAIYKHGETKIFNPTWAKTLLKVVVGNDLGGKKWLDISAGWGDRLITAMSLDMEYLGFDPNTNLIEGHSKMIEMFGNKDMHRVIYEPFENAILPQNYYDVVLSSPPFFSVEEYAPDQEGQSIVSYPDFNTWMVKFLFVALEKAWNALTEGGYLILHLSDTRSIKSCEATNIYIENYLIGASWEGILSVQGKAGYPRPVWVWKKVFNNRKVWNPEEHRNIKRHDTTRGPLHFESRTLQNTYPELQKEMVYYYASKISPNFEIDIKNASAIRTIVSQRLPTIPKSSIDEILSNDLMINNILHSIGEENTVKWASAIVTLAFPR